MKFFPHRDNAGFSLIEILIVIAILGLVSTVVLAGLNEARGRSRDARRKSDLRQIKLALIMNYNENGNWIEAGSGCGYSGSGNGWFNASYGPATTYPKSIGQCLVDAGFTATEIKDPTKGMSSSPTSGYTYMKYTCNSPKKTYIYAKLETLPQSETATDGTCSSALDTLYGMNYYEVID